MTIDLDLDASTDRQIGRLNRAAFASSASDEWSTPAQIFAVINREFGPFDLDPCCTAESAKAADSARQGCAVVCLVPAQTDTRWFWSSALPGEVLLLPGRLKFGDGRNSAPFPSCLVLLRPGLPWWGSRMAAWDWRKETYRGLPWPG
jgi:hypothetical protein